MDKNKKLLLSAALIVATAAAMIYFHRTGMMRHCTSEGIKSYVNSCGMFGPIIYMVMFSVIPSGAIIAIAGGMAFGMGLGTLYTMLGALIGATTAFYISRLLGRDFVMKLTRGRLRSFDDGVEKHGFKLILVMRLIPIIPFNLISFGAGLTKMNFRDYIMATVLGIVPGVIVFTNLGDKAMDVKSPQFIMAVGILLLLLVASYFFKRKVNMDEFQKKLAQDDIKSV
ncbi:MAG: TVP38/TMEM64 family protein [Peptoclostridium sp.]|uniref:TVP38/TMEM64 family protein n=1 Tax=Peptoclostridium sp. TaxID=1904860 RepID=UPI00139E3093|nr:TVP38/TMEM64 family protein [Peptoclostridium sp.]MZQ75282.1 TVP38/TMEM64 family protein [Peptoclostridium sp.]